MAEKPPTILVVDDDPDLVEIYIEWLEDDYSVKAAYGGKAGLEKFDSEIDAVLLDRQMPISGDEVLERIRAQGYDCPVGMVTAVDPDFDIVDMEFDDYRTKPVSSEELRSLVDELLQITSYDDVMQQYFQLASKKATLENTMSQAELAESDEYAELLAELQQIEQQADEQAQSLSSETGFTSFF